jgi:hypothetical protein
MIKLLKQLSAFSYQQSAKAGKIKQLSTNGIRFQLLDERGFPEVLHIESLLKIADR